MMNVRTFVNLPTLFAANDDDPIIDNGPDAPPTPRYTGQGFAEGTAMVSPSDVYSITSAQPKPRRVNTNDTICDALSVVRAVSSFGGTGVTFAVPGTPEQVASALGIMFSNVDPAKF